MKEIKLTGFELLQDAFLGEYTKEHTNTTVQNHHHRFVVGALTTRLECRLSSWDVFSSSLMRCSRENRETNLDVANELATCLEVNSKEKAENKWKEQALKLERERMPRKVFAHRPQGRRVVGKDVSDRMEESYGTEEACSLILEG